MSLIIPEFTLQAIFQYQAYNLATNYATYGPDVYGNLPTSPFNWQVDAQNWWMTEWQNLTVQQGLAWQEEQVPLIAIVPLPSNESDQFIGEIVNVSLDESSGTYSEQHGTEFTTQINLHILTANANLMAYLKAFVEWVLLTQRTTLTEAGLMEQKVTVSELRGQSDATRTDSIPVFERVFTLSFSHYDTYTVPGVIPSGATVDVTTN